MDIDKGDIEWALMLAVTLWPHISGWVKRKIKWLTLKLKPKPKPKQKAPTKRRRGKRKR